MRRTVAGHTALHLAARAHAPPEVIEGLMKLQPAAIRARDRTSQTPLHLACCGGVPYKATRSTSVRHAVGAHAGVDPAKRARAVVDALLSQESSDVAGAVDESGRTPVELAVVHQLWTCVESLVEACPRAVARADHRETPLWALAEAARRHGAAVLKALEEAHPRENMTLIALIRCGFWLDAINAVREQGAHSKDTRDRTPLHVCAMHPDAPVGLIVAVKESWPQAANQRDKAGRLPLHHSAHHGGPAGLLPRSWKSNSELGGACLRIYCETFVNLNAIEQTQEWRQPRVDGVELYTPSSRCSYRDDVASMVGSRSSRPPRSFAVHGAASQNRRSDDERFIRQVVAEEEARRARCRRQEREGL